MLTIFTIPKPFQGHIGIIQTNAIQSWTRLRPACEIILFGDEEGTAAVASKFGIRHVPDVERNEYATPLVNSLFNAAQTLASHDYIGYVNADIILMSDFIDAIRQVQEQSSLIIGRRWDLDLKEPLDFSNPDWESQLRSDIQMKGTLHGTTGIDYFIFPRGIYRDIPPFAIGRTAWDNWLVYKARSLGLPVIDATKVITAVHQNHDYSPHIMGEAAVWKGPEAERNRELLGGDYHAFGLVDATHCLTAAGLKLTMTMSVRYPLYRILRLPEMHPHWIPLMQIIKGLRLIIFGAAALRRRMLKHDLKQRG